MKTVKVFATCVIAAIANNLLFFLVVEIFKLPLFLDTLFTCTIAFGAGTLPGIFTAILTTAIGGLSGYHPLVLGDFLFALCSISEVLLISIFKRHLQRSSPHVISRGESPDFLPADPYSPVSKTAVLLLLYICMCMTVSILGGIIDFTIAVVLKNPDYAVFPQTYFKLGLLRNRLPLLAVDILSRIPVNIVDRFIAAFGGYGLGLLLQRVLGPGVSPGTRRTM